MSQFKVTKQIEVCYGHRLLNYDGKCKHLHGHNGLLEIDGAAGSLDSRGMVIDFGIGLRGLENALVVEQRDDPAVVPARHEITDSALYLDGLRLVVDECNQALDGRKDVRSLIGEVVPSSGQNDMSLADFVQCDERIA